MKSLDIAKDIAYLCKKEKIRLNNTKNIIAHLIKTKKPK